MFLIFASIAAHDSHPQSSGNNLALVAVLEAIVFGCRRVAVGELPAFWLPQQLVNFTGRAAVSSAVRDIKRVQGRTCGEGQQRTLLTEQLARAANQSIGGVALSMGRYRSPGFAQHLAASGAGDQRCSLSRFIFPFGGGLTLPCSLALEHSGELITWSRRGR